MIIEGIIRGVMETWPLQLSIETASGVRDIGLSDRTKVVDTRGSRAAHDLCPGQVVRVTVEPVREPRSRASLVEIIDETGISEQGGVDP
jgi:hypothetical protein